MYVSFGCFTDGGCSFIYGFADCIRCMRDVTGHILFQLSTTFLFIYLFIFLKLVLNIVTNPFHIAFQDCILKYVTFNILFVQCFNVHYKIA